MKEKGLGIAAAGNWILDITKIIDVFPEQETLANIERQSVSNGGAAYNILKDLAILGVDFPLKGIGLVGNDEAGKSILEDCKIHNIETRHLKSLDHINTSFTDVMLVKNTGKRTFFHHRGANAMLDIQHIDLKAVQSKIIHLGYLLLLDRLDEFVNNKRTKASIILEEAKKAGLITSVDLVSENSDRFRQLIQPSLPYIDYLFLNEFEAGKLTGIAYDTERYEVNTLKKMVKTILSFGVNDWVILHSPEGVVAGNQKHEYIILGSLNIPQEKIMGTTGAGDALAAGVLLGVHEGWNMYDSIKLGICAAGACLSHTSCSDGMGKIDSVIQLEQLYTTRNLDKNY